MYEVLFQYGSVTLRTFNIFLALAFFVSGALFIRFIHRQKMDLNFFLRYAFPILGGAVIGGRLVHVFEHFSFFLQNPLDIFFIWDLQFSFFGVLYGFLIVLFFFTRRSREDFWSWLDAGALSLIAAMFLVHIGHFFNGTEYGTPTTLPWGIAFDAQNIPFFHPIHPTQLYGALLSLILSLYFLKKIRRVHLSGVVGSSVLMVYSLGMLGIDFFRGDSNPLYNKISFGIIAVFSFVSLVHCSHKSYNESIAPLSAEKNKEPETPESHVKDTEIKN